MCVNHCVLVVCPMYTKPHTKPFSHVLVIRHAQTSSQSSSHTSTPTHILAFFFLSKVFQLCQKIGAILTIVMPIFSYPSQAEYHNNRSQSPQSLNHIHICISCPRCHVTTQNSLHGSVHLSKSFEHFLHILSFIHSNTECMTQQASQL